MVESIQAAIIGAGPAGLFAAEKLAQAGYGVAVFNRDIKPGGMAEYGIYPEKHALKAGLRKQFQQILANDKVHYYGNLCIGTDRCITIETLRSWGVPAILVACGAQGTKWLGIPGEKLTGVYHAKDLVYHYNLLPPFSTMDVRIGAKVVVVGAGNVMADITRHLLTRPQVREVHICVRRGPAEVKFSRKELEPIIRNFDLVAFDREIARVAEMMRAIGQDPEAEKASILCALERAEESKGSASVYMHFLSSPTKIEGDDEEKVASVTLEDNTLVQVNGEVKARGLGTFWSQDADTVIFAIGDRVEEGLGLAVQHNEFLRTARPDHPVDGQSYEVADPQTGEWQRGLFVAGWSRVPSSGLVGNAKKDGINAACAMIQHFQAGSLDGGISMGDLEQKITALECDVVMKPDLLKLMEIEKQKALELGIEEYKFVTNEEMLNVILPGREV